MAPRTRGRAQKRSGGGCAERRIGAGKPVGDLGRLSLLTACTQWLWLAYAPITTQTHQIMRVSEGAVGDLAGIFPFVYVILALPAGRWLDAWFGWGSASARS